MLADLTDDRLDLAVLLTEGAALGLARELPIRAVSLYTTSPLIWGIHVAPGATFKKTSELRGARFAISRLGSGSHLMSLALAIEQGWPTGELAFEVVDDIEGAAAALARGEADAFLWEHFTTEPAIEAGRFRRIDDLIAPWAAWVICASEACWQRERSSIEGLIRHVASRATELAGSADAAVRIAHRCGLKAEAVEAWLGKTQWVRRITSPESALAAARSMLMRAGAI